MQVLATGLDNPRGLIVADDGVVLVTEAGRGGSGPCIIGAQDLQFCLGATGAVTAVKDGQQRRVVTGLPSLRAPSLSFPFILIMGGFPLVPLGFRIGLRITQ
jgi:hypothetical protein